MSNTCPSVEQLTNVIRTVHTFLQAAEDCCCMEGQTRPPEFPLPFHPVMAASTLLKADASLNPKGLPFGENGRKGFLVRGWANPRSVAGNLQWLRGTLDKVIQLWGLAPLCGRGEIAIQGQQLLRKPRAGPDGCLHVPLSWPPPIPLAMRHTLYTALEKLAENLPTGGTAEGEAPGSARHKADGGLENNTAQRARRINARMLETIQTNPEAMGWNSRQWADSLKCAKSSIVETQTWKDLTMRRDRERAERAKDRRRRPKASEHRRD